GCLFNFPRLWGQTVAQGNAFFKGFYENNIGRYYIEKTHTPVLNSEYWAFQLYSLVGMVPYTFLLLGTLFKKGFWAEIKKDKVQQILLLGFVPGLILFSLSGHVKLGRYIAFVFPFLSVWLGARLFQYELKNKKFIKRSLY